MTGCLLKTYRASRAAWERERGTIPDGMSVLHVCDEPLCVRMDHLFLGTQQENIDDMRAKGRQNYCRGEDNHSILCESEVLLIRKMRLSQQKLADWFGVSRGTIRDILNRRTWRHI